jgi:hypothetical protein
MAFDWLGIGLGAATALLNKGNQKSESNRTYEQNKKLMGLQHQNQRDLNRQGNQLQMDMWNKTNYGAQKKHMKEAGLNAGLMYGMSGGGGTTTGSQGGGSAASGSAAAPQALELNQSLQNGLLMAQKENIEADTANKEAQVKTETQKSGLTLQQAMNEAEKVYAASRENKIGDATMESNIKGILDENVGKMLDAELKKLGLNKTEEEIKELKARVIQNWIKAGAQGVGALSMSVSGIIKGLLKGK